MNTNLDNPKSHNPEPDKEISCSPIIFEKLNDIAKLIDSMKEMGIRLNIHDQEKTSSISGVGVIAIKIEGHNMMGVEDTHVQTNISGLGFKYQMSGEGVTEIDGSITTAVISIHKMGLELPMLLIISSVGEGAYEIQAIRPKQLDFAELVNLYRNGQKIPKEEIKEIEAIRTEDHKVIQRVGSSSQYFPMNIGDKVSHDVGRVIDGIISPFNEAVSLTLRDKGYVFKEE